MKIGMGTDEQRKYYKISNVIRQCLVQTRIPALVLDGCFVKTDNATPLEFTFVILDNPDLNELELKFDDDSFEFEKCDWAFRS